MFLWMPPAVRITKKITIVESELTNPLPQKGAMVKAMDFYMDFGWALHHQVSHGNLRQSGFGNSLVFDTRCGDGLWGSRSEPEVPAY